MKTMKETGFFIITAVICYSIASASLSFSAEGDIKLPQPSITSDVSIEKALSERRSLRTYKNEPVTLNELSQLLWAGQGITEPEKGFRTAPSGMATYVLNLYAITLDVSGVPQGAYRYEPKGHELILISKGDKREDMKNDRRPSGPSPGGSADDSGTSATPARIAGHADPIPSTPLIFVITGDGSKARGSASYYLEAGHAAQNIALQCVSLGMGGVTMAGFNADKLKDLLKMKDKDVPIYVMPVGKK
ncbi:SagB/ThcOx family dehydrogenase [Deltaproteobacteria bacterium]|nr:SagB/ThcOx family dehydrogenase [Deltaproteobacteria bacterium]